MALKDLDQNLRRRLLLVVTVITVGTSAATIFVSRAFAVGAHTVPCLPQSDAFTDAKINLQKCVDDLDQVHPIPNASSSAVDEKAGTKFCVSELNEVNQRGKELRDCKSKESG